MPVHANRIVFGADPEDPADYYPFEDMRGRLQPMEEQLEGTLRPGHRGETLRKTGVRALPSTIITLHYVEDWLAAADALLAYKDLIGSTVRVIQHTTPYGYFKVMSPVVEIHAQACESVVGSILQAEQSILPAVMHVVQFHLIATDDPEA